MSSKIIHLDVYVLIFLIIAGMTTQAHAETLSCLCVAFRLDDIQDNFLNNAQIEVMNTFQEKNASLTVGVIGNYFGNDQKLLDYIEPRIEQNNPKIEIANHGWNHEDFTMFDKNEQSSLIKKTNEKIFNTLGIVPTGFITPFNTINGDTLTAMRENNMQYISANVTEDRPPYRINDNTLYHFPGTAFTGNLNDNNNAWLSKYHKESFAQIQSSLINYGYAVVMLHPQEYSIRDGLNYKNEVDINQIHELEMLIDEIKDSGLRIVTIKEIPEHVTHQKIPIWVNSIFTWYDNKKISTDEVLNAVNFLIERGIIRFNL